MVDPIIRKVPNLPTSTFSRILELWNKERLDSGYQDAILSVLSRLWSMQTHQNINLNALPVLCCEAISGNREKAEGVNAAWSLLYAASYLLDKIDDDEICMKLCFPFSMGCKTNIATGLIITSQLLLNGLEEDGIDFHVASVIRANFNSKILTMCAGQHSDLTLIEPTLDQAWQVTKSRSAEFFALGCYSGSRVASDDPEQISLLTTFGSYLGMVIQIANDLGGLWDNGFMRSDLAKGKRRLPVVYALSVLPSDKANKLRKYLNSMDSDSFTECRAREMIVESGAVIYLMIELEKHKQKSRKVLNEVHASLVNIEQLLTLLNNLSLRLSNKQVSD
jgi:hypothetical protein